MAANPIVSVGYNYNHEKERKRCLAYLLSRTPGQSTEEAAILEEVCTLSSYRPLINENAKPMHRAWRRCRRPRSCRSVMAQVGERIITSVSGRADAREALLPAVPPALLKLGRV